MTDIQLTEWSLRLLTEAEARRVLQCGEIGHDIAEWKTVNMTFILCRRGIQLAIPGINGGRTFNGPVIIRTSAMGGDLFEMHGGWVFLTIKHALAQMREIKEVAKAYDPEANR